MKYKLIWSLFFLLISSSASAYNINFYESEPNNTKASATLLPYNYTIKKGNISALNDVDWYKIRINRESSLIIQFEHLGDNYIYNLFLVKVYNSSDVLLSQKYIYAPDESTIFEVGLGGEGVYYIVVETACQSNLGRCEYHRSDEYSLTVSLFNADDYFRETEPNDTAITADNYENGGIITGQISTISDEDFFVVKTNGAADIKVDFYHPGDNYQYNLFYIDIIDSNGVVLNSTDIYAPDDLTNLGFSVATAGNYYLKIKGCQSGSRCNIHGTDQYTIQTLISPLDTAPPNANTKVVVIPLF